MNSFPPYLTIDIHNYCNASCGYCPYVQIAKTSPQGFMKHDLFTRIADECEVRKSEIGEVRFSNIGESLMGGEKSWWYLEQWITRGLDLLFASNMTYFDEKAQERLERLGWKGKIIAHVEPGMGTDIERAMGHYHLAAARWPEPERVRLVQPQITGLRYWARDPDIKPRIAHSCTADRPNNTMIIGYDGLISLCCVDSKREVICGDLNTMTIAEAWTGPQFMEARNALSQGVQDLCNHCDWGKP